MVYTEISSFDWNEAKNISNFKKHGIHFEEAVKVFFDPLGITKQDLKHSAYELRYQIIGATEIGLLFVVFTERKKFRLRIISARICNKKERSEYEKQTR